MAAFTNQFTTPDPFNLPGRPNFFYGLKQIASKAGSLLEGRSPNWLHSMAKQVECVLREFAKSPVLPERGPKQAHAVFARRFLGSGEIHRDTYGDVNLFLARHTLHGKKSESVLSERWERFAILALWKVVDANAALGVLTTMPQTRHSQRRQGKRLRL